MDLPVGSGCSAGPTKHAEYSRTMATLWDRITDERYKQWLINRQFVAEEFNQISLVDRITLRNQFEQQQQQQQDGHSPPPVSPTRSRGQPEAPPASDGMKASKKPRIYSLDPPSSEKEPGPKSALKYVASESLYCSSNRMAMDVVKLLEISSKENLEDKYEAAATHFLAARQAILQQALQEEQVNRNERFFSSAFCEALSAVVDEGMSVLHQGCIGHGPTHSDFSARHILGPPSTTLMVGEAKANHTMDIREETRGQVLNELIRHRKIDEKLGRVDGSHPVLLLSLNFSLVKLDLAFPSKKGNSMEKRGWLTFEKSLVDEMETFWTVQVASIDIGGNEGTKKLPIVLRFIVETLRYLKNLKPKLPRAQFKTPFLTEPEEELEDGEKRGDNVTIISTKSGKRVYKEFCYYLREEDGLNKLTWGAFNRADQRKPPDRELLEKLGEPYCNWKVEAGPFQIKILSYDFIDGGNWPTSRKAWCKVLAQVQTMHELGYVHGDLLPRNFIFSGEFGYVIDFDLTRKEGEPYVSRYNHEDFAPYRHEDAKACCKVEKKHDVWAVNEMTREFFGLSVPQTVETIDALILFF